MSKPSKPPIRSMTSTLDLSNKQLEQNAGFPEIFPQIEKIIESFREKPFLELSLRRRFKKVNQTLCQLIQEAPHASYLLSAVLDYMDRINQEQILNEPLNFATFEFWLNNFSELSEQDNLLIRAKIVGKFIPRSDYQAFFPVGMGRIFGGSHFVAAHLSPDIDTMIASFWGWMDAFSARLGTGLHFWCLPGGPPESPITAIFRERFGKNVFTAIARTAHTLTLTAMDLVNQKNFSKEKGETLTSLIDHSLNENAVILVNENGHYLGDWRTSDVEIVRQITILFKSCLRWFENNLHTKLISLFAKKDLSIQDTPAFNSSVFDVKIKDCEPALEFSEKQKQDLNDFFRKVLGVEKGLEGTFGDLNLALSQLGIPAMHHFQLDVESLPLSDIFNQQGILKEDRPKIFNHLEKLIKDLDEAIHIVRNYVERLDVVIAIKHKVLNFPSLYITLRSDVDEMRYKMQNYDFLTVVIQEHGDEALFPVGVVKANDLRKNTLGTVTLRDFCNQEEVKMASYLEVISVVDHHKSSLKTLSVPAAVIGDAQSCNVLIAEQDFLINDRYSLGGMTLESIENQIEEHSQSLTTSSQMRILQRLLQRRMAALSTEDFFIHPKRELDEYLCFLEAILDDTDLLTKVSNRDVECVAQILNRIKSLSEGREVEIIHFDDIPKDKNFAKMTAQRILQQADMYAIYKQIYNFRELEVESNLELCIQGQKSSIFMDTKEQNGCARVGQTKMFACNFQYFLKHAQLIRSFWLAQAQEVHQAHPEIDFHLQMISTIASAEEVYHSRIGPYKHQDELWFWVPDKQQAYDHLTSFLSGFQSVIAELKEMSVEFLGPNAEEFARIFAHHFPPMPQKISPHPKTGLPIAVLRFKAGSLNSRKSMITPFIPRMIS